jgi:hypothetical protein
MKQLKDSGWGDKRYTFTVEVQVAHDRDNPTETAKRALAERIGPLQTETDWDNRFAIVTRIS